MRDICKDWIENLVLQRNTLYSNGIIVETEDKRRIEEILNKKPEIIKGDEKERWLVLDSWEGFYQIKQNNSEITKEHFKDGDVQKYGIRQVLPAVSKELSEGRTILVMTNIFKTDDFLNCALRSWSTSEELREKDSTVILFVDDRCVFPPEVWTHMKLIKPPRSTTEERLKTFQFLQKEIMSKDKKKKANILSDTELTEAIRLAAGMNLDQLESAGIESIILKDKLSFTSLAQSKLEIMARDPVADIIQRPKFGFEAIGGYTSLKQRIIDDVVMPLKYPEYAEYFCMKPPRGMLLYGPEGTGKTLLVKSMAKELNMSIVRILPENILGKYVGESEKSLRKAFDIADNMGNCILFIDELDRFSKRQDDSSVSSHVERELFSMLLEKLGDEDREWFFAGATNMIECIDPALRRTGRIDSVAPVPYPDRNARKEIFNIHVNIKRKLPCKELNFDVLAEKTYMWSGSDIEQFIIRTANFVMRESIKEKKKLFIVQDDFLEMYETFNIPIRINEAKQLKVMNNVLDYTNDKRLMDVFSEAERSQSATDILQSEEKERDKNHA